MTGILYSSVVAVFLMLSTSFKLSQLCGSFELGEDESNPTEQGWVRRLVALAQHVFLTGVQGALSRRVVLLKQPRTVLSRFLPLLAN